MPVSTQLLGQWANPTGSPVKEFVNAFVPMRQLRNQREASEQEREARLQKRQDDWNQFALTYGQGQESNEIGRAHV